MSHARVTITLPAEIVSAIEHEDHNRSRFVLQAVTRELDRIQREQLVKSLQAPHPESLELAETGFNAWASGLGEDASDLVNPGTGKAVQWSTDRGWVDSKR